MTCSDGPFELITRPYPYKREPFQLASGELVTYEGVYFAIPASGLLLDKRLFTAAASHPVDSPIRLYINRDADVSAIIEPDDDGAVYTSGTPHYADYILDLRSLIDDVTALHAADSDHSAQQFLEDHLRRTRATYDLTGVGTPDGEYVHPEPLATVPSGTTPPGSSGSIPPPGDGYELGARQIMDIDVDEVQWQAIARPKKKALGTPGSIPVEPIFPLALPGGGAPSYSSLDLSNLTKLALNGSTSGGLVVTGDGLVAGTSIKLASASGSTPEGEGNFLQVVPWKQFPCGEELCQYYTPHAGSGSINALGRQAVYAAPGSLSEGVYMLIASDASDTSGLAVQHWPSNYHGTSGIDENGHAHDGVHVTDKLIFNLNSAGVAVGYSPINGKKVFGHWVGEETGSKGETFGSAGPKYQNNNSVYAAGSIVRPRVSATTSTQNWATTGATLSPINWATLSTTALGPRPSIFGAPESITYAVADIQAGSSRGVITRKVYAQWGYIDQIVAPDQDRAQGGQRQTATITSTTIEYAEGKDPVTGEFIWVEIGQSTSTREVAWYDNTYLINNVYSFFFGRKLNHDMVHVNGNVYIQWSDRLNGIPVKPAYNKFAIIGTGTQKLVPPKARVDVRVSIGFFPSWKLRRYVTTSNQVSVPDFLSISPAGSQVITAHPDLDFDLSTVDSFGPAIWDDSAGVNYIWFTALVGGSLKTFFAHMDTSFRIFRINQTAGDGIFSGRTALLPI